MAKITQYQQGQLANTQVGTPFEHLDSMAAMAPAEATENFGNAVSGIASGMYKQQQAQALAQQKAQQAAQLHLDNLSRETQATSIATSAEADAHKDMNDIQMQYRDNPAEGVSQYNAMAQGRIGSTVQQVSQQHPNDPDLVALVNQKLTNNHATRMNSMGSWADAQQVPNMKKNLDESGAALGTQLSNMGGQPIQGAISSVVKWADDTRDQFHQVDPKGIAGQQPHIDDAMKQRLLAGALKGDPKASEAEVEEVRKSGIMTPAALFGVKSEVAAQAAHQAAVNAQALAGSQSATLLDTIKKLTDNAGGGNGNMENNNPAYNRQIIQAAAPNLKSDHLISLLDKTGMGQSKVEAAQSKSAFESEVAAQSPNGDISKASPDVLKAGLEKYGKGMTPEERAQYEPMVAKNQVKAQQAAINNNIEGSLAQQMTGLHNLNGQIQHQMMVVSGLTHGDPAMHAKALNTLNSWVQQFGDSYAAMQKMRNAIQEPQLKSLVEKEMPMLQKHMQDNVSLLNAQSDPVRQKQIQAHTQLYSDLYNTVSPAHKYSDPKIQATYNYYYQRQYYDTINKMGLTDAQLTHIKNNPTQASKMKSAIDHQTTQALSNLKLIPQ